MADQESSGCVFCAIGAGEVPADVVHRSESVVAFRDLDTHSSSLEDIFVGLVHQSKEEAA